MLAVTAALVLCLLAPAHAPAQSQNGSPNLVISQVYTRGGEAGASYRNDFVEIFNRGTEPVNLNNYGLYATLGSSPVPAAMFVRIFSPVGLVIQPGRYLLIGLKGDGAGGQTFTPNFDLSLLPAPVPANLNAVSGTVALILPDGFFQGCSAAQAGVVDMVGYGPTPICFEGLAAGPAAAPGPTEALQRNLEGCADNNVNALDFHLGPPNPRNSSTPAGPCSFTTPPSFFNFAVPQFDTHEGAGRAVITVTRTGITTEAASVEYAVTGGTAFGRSDYTTAAGRLRFAPGETQKTFDLLLTDDATQELNETVELLIWKPQGAGAAIGFRDTATLVIHDNDFGPAASNPIDSSAFFVRQHYHDFLNREPDAAGLAFWTQGIESCGADAQCREVKRIDTSAAFFLSIEFQRTGFFVYSLYRAALPERDYRLRSLPRYLEFVRDTQEVGRDVVVGRAGWEQKLEANVALFLEDFMSRPEFALAYPQTLTPPEYVDKLNAQAGGPLTQAERDQLVAGMLLGTETRATVLRRVAESPEFTRRETSRAFVMMQYL
ncbi:MAG TPA: Calx-beta domain-containing protein, partial [Pyrinomonadaceae bacterium]